MCRYVSNQHQSYYRDRAYDRRLRLLTGKSIPLFVLSIYKKIILVGTQHVIRKSQYI